MTLIFFLLQQPSTTEGGTSMGGTSQANWSSPPPGATLNYTANQTMASNSNISSDWGGPGGFLGFLCFSTNDKHPKQV